MKYSRTTFVFTPELGAKLRALRRQQNMSMKDLATLMGRDSPGAFNHLAKRERGELKQPSVGLVLDYLRACRVGSKDVAELFDSYLSLPPVPRVKGDAAVKKLVEMLPARERKKVIAWDKGLTRTHEERALAEPEKRKPRVETEGQRVFRIVRSFVHANWSEVFEQKLYETMLKLKHEVPRSRRRAACDISRRFFGVLTRHYTNVARRQNSLDRIEQRAKEEGFSKETIATLLDVANQSCRELLLSGRLDWKPTQEELISRSGQAPQVLRAEARMDLDDVRPGLERSMAEGLVRTMVFLAVNQKLDEAKLDFVLVKRHYHIWVDWLVPIALAHGTDSPEWQAEVDAAAPKLHDETFARAVAEHAAETFNRWKVKLPPKSLEPR